LTSGSAEEEFAETFTAGLFVEALVDLFVEAVAPLAFFVPFDLLVFAGAPVALLEMFEAPVSVVVLVALDVALVEFVVAFLVVFVAFTG
jgi:hypothetical protein